MDVKKLQEQIKKLKKNTFKRNRLVNNSPAHEIIVNLFSRFHLVARRLRKRYCNRAPFIISDEYDVQDLLQSLLTIYFDDIRPEEHTPSYCGRSSRMDFLLKNEKTVIEVKRTRETLKEGDIGTQLIEDINRYKTHPDCETLICFIYDPERLLDNPRGLESDLSRTFPLQVSVFVRPI